MFKKSRHCKRHISAWPDSFTIALWSFPSSLTTPRGRGSKLCASYYLFPFGSSSPLVPWSFSVHCTDHSRLPALVIFCLCLFFMAISFTQTHTYQFTLCFPSLLFKMLIVRAGLKLAACVLVLRVLNQIPDYHYHLLQLPVREYTSVCIFLCELCMHYAFGWRVCGWDTNPVWLKQAVCRVSSISQDSR